MEANKQRTEDVSEEIFGLYSAADSGTSGVMCSVIPLCGYAELLLRGLGACSIENQEFLC